MRDLDVWIVCFDIFVLSYGICTSFFMLLGNFLVTSHSTLFQTLPTLLSPTRLLLASSFLMSLLASPSALSIFPSPGIAAPVSFPLP